MSDASHLEHTAQQLGGFNIGRTNQHRPSGRRQLHYPVDYGSVFGFLRFIDKIILIVADNRTICGNHHDVQLINTPELPCLGLCRTGHTGQFMVHPEIVLQGNGGKGLGCSFNLDILLCFHRLMQSVTPPTSFHHTAGLLVNNFDLAVHYDVVDVLLKHRVCLQQLIDGVNALAL